MNVTFDFGRKNFVLVGVSSGIGRQVALELSASGANVLAVGRNLERLDALRKSSPVSLIKLSSRIFVEQLDVTTATVDERDNVATCSRFKSGGTVDAPKLFRVSKFIAAFKRCQKFFGW